MEMFEGMQPLLKISVIIIIGVCIIIQLVSMVKLCNHVSANLTPKERAKKESNIDIQKFKVCYIMSLTLPILIAKLFIITTDSEIINTLILGYLIYLIIVIYIPFTQMPRCLKYILPLFKIYKVLINILLIVTLVLFILFIIMIFGKIFFI